ncbi:EF-hand protein [Mortierella sp. GBAus27b]|nr:EF-hand protein [Mortierella sp. GBAus27b]
MASVSEDQLAEYKEGFSLFDRKGNGTIETSSLGDLLRALGQNPTQAQVQGLAAEADPSGTNLINFDTFLKVLMRQDGFKPAGTFQEFINGFKVFDKEGNGYITVGELRYVLTNLGEKLTDPEVDELLKGVEVEKGGKVNYEEFVKMIMAS